MLQCSVDSNITMNGRFETVTDLPESTLDHQFLLHIGRLCLKLFGGSHRKTTATDVPL